MTNVKDDEQAKVNPPGNTQGGATGGAASGTPGGTQGAVGGARDKDTKGGGAARGGGASSGSGGTRKKPDPQIPAVGRDDGLLQLSPAALQQMLAAAVAAATSSSNSTSDGPKLPKFWDEEPAAWFSVFRGHFAGRDPPVYMRLSPDPGL